MPTLESTLAPGDLCPSCKGRIEPDPNFDPPNFGHTPMLIDYRCHACGCEWHDDWCAAVDGQCPECGETNAPLTYDYL